MNTKRKETSRYSDKLLNEAYEKIRPIRDRAINILRNKKP
jgi:hypothetical protein